MRLTSYLLRFIGVFAATLLLVVVVVTIELARAPVPYGEGTYASVQAVARALGILAGSLSDDPSSVPAWGRFGVPLAALAGAVAVLLPHLFQHMRRSRWVRTGGHWLVWGGGHRLETLLVRGFFDQENGRPTRIVQILENGRSALHHPRVVAKRASIPKDPILGPSKLRELRSALGLDRAFGILFVDDEDEDVLSSLQSFIEAQPAEPSRVERLLAALDQTNQADPIEQSSRRRTRQLIRRPIRRPSGGQTQRRTVRPTERRAGRRTGRTIRHPSGRRAGRRIGVRTGQPIRQPIRQPSGRRARRRTVRPTERLIREKVPSKATEALIERALDDRSSSKPEVRAHFRRPQFWRVLAHRLTWSEGHESAAVRLFSVASLEAKTILSRFPPGRVVEVHSQAFPGAPSDAPPGLTDAPPGSTGGAPRARVLAPRAFGPHLLVIGFAEQGEAILLEWLLRGHLALAPPPLVTVVARDANRHERDFFAAFPKVREVGPIAFREGDPRSSADRDAILDLFRGEGPPELIVVNLTEPAAEALERDLEREHLFRPPIILWSDRQAPKVWWGPELEKLRIERLESKWEDQARAVHTRYLVGQLARLKKLGDSDRQELIREKPTIDGWWSLSEEIREDNRRQLEHMSIKLADVGWRLVPAPPGSTTGPHRRWASIWRSRVNSAPSHSALAEAEHRRWVASRYTDGWQHDEKRDDRLRRHPNLVPYRTLDEATREYDLDAILDIPEVLRNSDVDLRPERRYLVEAPLDEACRKRLDRLKRKAHRCQLVAVFLVDIADASTETLRDLLEEHRRMAGEARPGHSPLLEDIEWVVEDRLGFARRGPVVEAVLVRAPRVWVMNLPSKKSDVGDEEKRRARRATVKATLQQHFRALGIPLWLLEHGA